MKKSFGIVAIFIVAALVLVTSAEAYQITGKQKISLQGQGLDNSCIITITNTEDTALLFMVKPTKQYYTPNDITFKLNENWLEMFDRHEWNEVMWIHPNEKMVQVLANSKKDVDFKILTDTDISSGTFYAQFETKDISKKEGTVVIRMVYATQVVGEIENPNVKVIPAFDGFLLLIGILLTYTFIRYKIKIFK